MNKYEEYSKEELIQLLLEFEEKRAFSYEDQLKLTIIDKSPFTIWTSDRNCIIHMWEGQCESMYGRKKEEVIGKDFVNLFVAQDEQIAARRDQLEIIDNGKEFHNIANDRGRYGNTLRLITICFRIKDPRSGEYWNAEMGMSIDYYEEELRQLAHNIEEGKLVQNLISDFAETQRQYREQFIDRKESLLAEIRNGKRDATKQGRLAEYCEQIQGIESKVKQIETDLDATIDEHYRLMRNCTSSAVCAEIKIKFNLLLRKVMNEFDDIVLDIEILNFDITNQTSLASLRDEVMKTTTAKNTCLEALAHELWLKAENEITEYSQLGLVAADSSHLASLKERKERIKALKKEIHAIGDETYSRLISAATEETVLLIKKDMERLYGDLEEKLHKE